MEVRRLGETAVGGTAALLVRVVMTNVQVVKMAMATFYLFAHCTSFDGDIQ